MTDFIWLVRSTLLKMSSSPQFCCKLHGVWRLVFLLACLLPLRVIAATTPDRPNILFIAIDDLNDWVGFLGGHLQTRTPNMDRLAKRGVVFANGNCAAPLCSPSRAAVFSGREPYNSGVYGNNDNIRVVAPELVLLPQHLGAQGYHTMGAGKMLHQKRADIFHESFFPSARWSPFDPEKVNFAPEELPARRAGTPRHAVDIGPGKPPVILPLNRMPSDRHANSSAAESFDWGAVDAPDSAMGDVQVVDWAIRKLENSAARPFFLGVGFYRPHIPLYAPAKYFAPFPVPRIQLPRVLANDLDDLPPVARAIALEPVTAGSHQTVLQHGQWPAAVAGYLACINFVDAQIGRLVDALDASPAAENTVVVLWGDHGWHLGEKQHWGKSTGWERAVRTPLAIIPPARDRGRFASGRESQQPVSLIDLYPTLLDLCGLPPPATPLDGQSLVPLLRDPDRATGRAIVTTFQERHFSVRDVRWRYIRYDDGSEELYDLHADPNEWHNLAGRAEMSAVKERLRASIPEKTAPQSPPRRNRPATG